jgi:hypothetical protein
MLFPRIGVVTCVEMIPCATINSNFSLKLNDNFSTSKLIPFQCKSFQIISLPISIFHPRRSIKFFSVLIDSFSNHPLRSLTFAQMTFARHDFKVFPSLSPVRSVKSNQTFGLHLSCHPLLSRLMPSTANNSAFFAFDSALYGQ